MGSLGANDANGPRYRVGYSGDDGETLLLGLGAVNSARPVTSEAVTVRGLGATWATTDGWPAQEVRWLEGPPGAQQLYTVQVGGTTLTRDELLRIVESLAPVPAPATPAAP